MALALAVLVVVVVVVGVAVVEQEKKEERRRRKEEQRRAQKEEGEEEEAEEEEAEKEEVHHSIYTNSRSTANAARCYVICNTSVLLSLYSDKSAVGKTFCGTWQLFWRS